MTETQTPEEREAMYHALDLHGVPLDKREEVIAVLAKIQDELNETIKQSFIGHGKQMTPEEQLQQFVDGLNRDPEYVRQYAEWRTQRPVKSAKAVSDGIGADGQLLVSFVLEFPDDDS